MKKKLENEISQFMFLEERTSLDGFGWMAKFCQAGVRFTMIRLVFLVW